MSFRARLVLAAAYLLAAVVIALAVPLALSVDRRATSELESDVVANATVLSSRVSGLVNDGEAERLEEVIDGATVGDAARTVVVSDTGALLADTEGAAAVGTPFATAERPEFQAALGGGIDVRRRHSDTLGEELLLVTVPVTNLDQTIGALRVSAPMGEVEASVRSSWLALALIGLAVVLAGLVLAWILAGSIARPVEKLRTAAGRLGRGDLDARVEPEGPQELDELGRSFNRMAGELSDNLAAQRDFVANASHQLRTPLTGIKLRLEAIRGEGGAAADEAAKAEAELDRLSLLVDDLLALARASSDHASPERVDLGDAVRSAGRRWAEPAATAGHDLVIAGRRLGVRLGRSCRRRPRPRQPDRKRHSLLALRLPHRGRGRSRRLRGLRHRPGYPAGRAGADLRALLPRRRRARGGTRHRPGPGDRGRARRALGWIGRAPRRPRDPRPCPLSGRRYRLLTRA